MLVEAEILAQDPGEGPEVRKVGPGYDFNSTVTYVDRDDTKTCVLALAGEGPWLTSYRTQK